MLFREENGPRYGPAFTTLVITTATSLLLVLFYRFLCVYSNKKRDKEGNEESFNNAYDDDFTDMTVCCFLGFLSRPMTI